MVYTVIKIKEGDSLAAWLLRYLTILYREENKVMKFNLSKILEIAKSDDAQITAFIMDEKMYDIKKNVRRYSREVEKVVHTYIDQVRWDSKLLVLTHAWQMQTGSMLNDDIDVYAFMLAYENTSVAKFNNLVYSYEKEGVLYA